MKTNRKPYLEAAIILLGLALPCVALAGSRESANYAVTYDAVDAGGARATSAQYSNEGSMDGFGGVQTVGGSASAARVGYVGQMLEVVNFAFSAATTNLNEGDSVPLSATQWYDDGSVSAVAKLARYSSVGSVTVTPGSGVVTAGNVYVDTPGAIEARMDGAFARLALMVWNVGFDDLGIYGGDGIPDLWQVQYFGVNNPAGTGPGALFKYTAGLNPTNPASVFTFAIAPAVAAKTRTLSFSPRLTNRTYVVEYRNSLSGGAFAPLTGAIQNDVGEVRTVTDTNAVSASRLYRVKISFP